MPNQILGYTALKVPRPRRGLRAILTFFVSMLVCTILCTILWRKYVTDVLYSCTDSVGLFDYVSGPGGWVHGKVAGGTEDFGDTIAPGWDMDRLRLLWCSFIAASLAISLATSWFFWSRNPSDYPRRLLKWVEGTPPIDTRQK